MAPVGSPGHWPASFVAILFLMIITILALLAHIVYHWRPKVPAPLPSPTWEPPPPAYNQTPSLQVRRRGDRVSTTTTFLTLETSGVQHPENTATQAYDFQTNRASVIHPTERGTVETASMRVLHSGAEEAQPPAPQPLIPPAPQPLTPFPVFLISSEENSPISEPEILRPAPLRLVKGAKHDSPRLIRSPYPRFSDVVEVVTEPPPAHLASEERSLRYLSLTSSDTDDKTRKQQKDDWEAFVAGAGRVAEQGEEKHER